MAASTDRLVLLSSSKTVKSGGDGPTWRSGPLNEGPLAALRRRLVRESQAAAKIPEPAFFDAAGEPLDQACRLALGLGRAPTMPAHERYHGQQWEAFGDGAGRPERVVVISGLWGPVLANTPVPPYLLPCGGHRADGSTIASAWQLLATRCLCAMADGRQVVDLLPPESREAIDIETLAAEAPVVTVEFVTDEGKPVHDMRLEQARGALAAHLSRGEGPASFATSPGQGWSWSRGGSTWTYVAV